MTVKELKTNNMPDPLNAAGNEQKMPKGKKTYGYTKKMTKIKRTNPKGASVNDFDDTVAKPSSPAGYTPYKMKGHELKGIKQRGVPFSGGVGSNEMESGVGDKFEGMPYSTTASPNKGLWDSIKNIGKKVKKGVGGALGLGGGGGTGGGKIKAMDDRISALEQGGGDTTGGPTIKGTDPIMAALNMGGAGGGGGDGDPMLAGAGMSGGIMEMMMKRKKAKQASWGGVGAEGAGI